MAEDKLKSCLIIMFLLNLAYKIVAKEEIGRKFSPLCNIFGEIKFNFGIKSPGNFGERKREIVN